MSNLVLVEHDGGALRPSTLNTVSAAKCAGGDIDLLIIGENLDAIANEAAKINAVSNVFVCDDSIYTNQIAEDIAPIIAKKATEYQNTWAPATTFGKNVLPRAAALLDIQQISDISAVIDSQTFERPIYAGNALCKVKSQQKHNFISARTTSFEPCEISSGSAKITPIEAQGGASLSRFIALESDKSELPELTTARIVVSGGRGMQSGENFVMLEDIASKLGAAVGASRAAVDAGFVPNDYQVGQTGKVVAPDLYIAVGISGAIQHLAGMKDSKTIVAINKDDDAPIFQVADYGLVADLFEAIPALRTELDK